MICPCFSQSVASICNVSYSRCSVEISSSRTHCSDHAGQPFRAQYNTTAAVAKSSQEMVSSLYHIRHCSHRLSLHLHNVIVKGGWDKQCTICVAEGRCAVGTTSPRK